MEKLKKTILQAIITGLTQGYWNASTNVPNIITTVEVGNMWYVSVSGNTLLGKIDVWNVGDWAIKFDSSWGKIINGISGSSGNTLIISDLDAVYYLKFGLKQEGQDIGFFDVLDYDGYYYDNNDNNDNEVFFPIGFNNFY